MKKACILAGFISIILYSCTTDFDVTAPWQDTTIVYGLLDQSDTAHYIRIEKAYLDQSTSALEQAQIPDSIYYADLNVQLEEIQNNNIVHTILLQKVDGNLEGYPKDTGIFASTPNILYKSTETLNPQSTYNLVITQPDNGKQITSSTPIIDDFTIFRPTPSIKLNLLPGFDYNVAWLSAKDGLIYALVIRIHYTEYLFADPQQKQEKFADWTVFTAKPAPSTTGGSDMDEDLIGDNFYTFLNSAIPSDNSVYRVLRNTDFIFSVGGETLDTYNQVLIAQQGLTSGQILPTYTNVSNGLGIFSTRYHKTVFDVPFGIGTIDSVACYSVTSHLNFLGSDSALCH